MTDIDPGVADDATTTHHALVGLHALAGEVDPGGLPGFHPPATAGAQLRAVAAASEQEVPVSTRVGLLYRLAKAGFPGYEQHADAYTELARSVATVRDLDADQLLSDVKESATEKTPFEATASGQALPHHEAAFVSTDVCTTAWVTVGGLRAVWIYSEFETDAPFDQVAAWVDPHNWPERGPLLFKSMQPYGPDQPVDVPDGLGTKHWRGVFREQVQLVSPLDTLLRCAFWRAGDSACGMTYDLALSLDNQIDVDRGFLLVNNLGPTRRHVRALKVVGFTTDAWDVVARLVCPFWTDWIRGAVRGGSTSRPGPSMPGPSGPGTSPSDDRLGAGDLLEQWMRFFATQAREYVDLTDEVGQRLRGGGYSAASWLEDGTRYWSMLAKDWASAWRYGLGALDEVAREGLDAGLVPPGAQPATARGLATSMTTATPGTSAGTTTLPVPGLAPGDKPVVSTLVSIEVGGAVLAASDLTVTVVPLDGGAGVRLSTTSTAAPAGLYVGTLQTTDGRVHAPVQLYVSGATAGGAP